MSYLNDWWRVFFGGMEYPYTDSCKYNDDWLLMMIKKLVEELDNFVNLNRIKYADPIGWDITRQYEANTVVVDNRTGNAYISSKPVPSGVQISNTNYWTEIYNYANVIDTLREQIAFNEGETTTASQAFAVGDLVFINGLLYRVVAPMIAGDSFVIDSNIEKTTIEAEISNILQRIQPIIDDVIAQITSVDNKIGNLSELTTETKTNLVSAINEIVASVDDLDYMPAIDVTKHGLVADGVTDNYAAFNALYATNKNLYFPEGTYYFSQPITISQRSSKLEGSGYNTFFLFEGDGILINNFYCEVSNFTMRTKGQGVFGIKLLSSYAKIHDIYMYDSAGAWFNNFIIGGVGAAVWYSLIENIFINDTNNNGNTNGVAFEFTSTVNNIFTNVIITWKDTGLKFNSDKTVGYSTDGAQLNDFNITQTKYAMKVDDCTSIYVSHSIFDQIHNKCLELIDAGNIVFDECYLSAGSLSISTYKIADIITSERISIKNSTLSGTGPSAFGLVIQSSKEVNVTDCTIGHTVSGITFSDANSSDCYMYNIAFDDLVNTKLYIQGYTNQYGLLKGTGTITVAGGLQCATILNQGTIVVSDLGTGFYYDCDIPLPAGMGKPIVVFTTPFNSDADICTAYLANTSPAGYVRIRIRKALNTVFNHESITLAYAYPIA